MKKKLVVPILLALAMMFGMVSLGLNIYFLATKPKSASGIFSIAKDSVLELKAEKEDVGTSYGSAVVINEDGTIITNAHVVTYKNLEQYYTFDKYYVRFVDEADFREVSLVKYDLDLDIAVLKIECDKELTAIKIGNDSKLDFGDSVYAIGNLSNHGISITSGPVSIPHVDVTYNEKTRNVIQCDLTISDGNSGGALVDAKGKLVGITTFRLKDNSNNVVYGISYCIPIHTVLEYIKK